MHNIPSMMYNVYGSRSFPKPSKHMMFENEVNKQTEQNQSQQS